MLVVTRAGFSREWLQGELPQYLDVFLNIFFSLSNARDILNIPSFLISSPNLKFTIFLYLSPIGHFDIADPSSMQDACHHELSKYDLCSSESPSSSVVRASDRCTEGHGFDSRWGLRFFLCPMLATC